VLFAGLYTISYLLFREGKSFSNDLARAWIVPVMAAKIYVHITVPFVLVGLGLLIFGASDKSTFRRMCRIGAYVLLALYCGWLIGAGDFMGAKNAIEMGME